jgi:transcriptional regulator with XRE-family HTH domain
MPSVGEELKRERELRGVTLREIAEETKIAVRFLEAIDSDRLDTIPGEFYRCASMRAYARYLGIDEDRIVATYRFRNSSGSLDLDLPQSRPGGGGRMADVFGALATKWVVLVVVGVALSGAAVAVWPVGDSKIEPLAISPSVVVPSGDTPVAEPVVREELEEKPSTELPLHLLLKVDESCWLEVQADGSLAAQGLMLRGYQKEIRAEDEVRLWLGNAGGISFWINGSPGIPLGGLGEVRKDVRITPDNVTDFVVTQEGPAGVSPEPSEDLRDTHSQQE